MRPTRVEAMFDAPSNGGKLSDHDGYKVIYRLSWPSHADASQLSGVADAQARGRLACLPMAAPRTALNPFRRLLLQIARK